MHKIYSRELSDDRLSGLGGAKFLAINMTCDHFMQVFLVKAGMQRGLIGLAFKGTAKKIYKSNFAAHLSASAEELWELLRTKLFNEFQRRMRRASFYAAKWQEKPETFAQLGPCLAASAMSLPEEVSKEVLIHQFAKDLPSKFCTRALLIS